jgi:hypothetical protein
MGVINESEKLLAIELTFSVNFEDSNDRERDRDNVFSASSAAADSDSPTVGMPIDA